MERSEYTQTAEAQPVHERSGIGPETTIRIKDLRIDISNEVVHIGDEHIPLTATEFRIFRTLVMQPSAVIRRGTLLLATSERTRHITSRSLDGHISRLRTKLRHYGSWIRTFKGIGYRFLPTMSPDRLFSSSRQDGVQY
jgi:two-component system phosphate regulon response regulator PhoB